MGYSFTPCSQPVKKRYEARGGRITRIAERIVERANVNLDGKVLAFHSITATHKKKGGGGGGGEYPYLAKQLANADSDT